MILWRLRTEDLLLLLLPTWKCILISKPYGTYFDTRGRVSGDTLGDLQSP